MSFSTKLGMVSFGKDDNTEFDIATVHVFLDAVLDNKEEFDSKVDEEEKMLREGSLFGTRSKKVNIDVFEKDLTGLEFGAFITTLGLEIVALVVLGLNKVVILPDSFSFLDFAIHNGFGALRLPRGTKIKGT
jgi:hypothetical protein